MRKILSLFIIVFGFIACDKDSAFDKYETLPGQWNKDSIVSFEVKDMDSLQPYDLFINIRNTNDYPYSNLYLITSMSFPHGKVVEDTLEYQMAKPNGEWLGVGIGEAKSSKLWYKKAVHFKEEGTYTFKIRQAMRKNGEREGVEELKGITEVGLRIEKSN